MKIIRFLILTCCYALPVLSGTKPVIKPGFPVLLARDNIWWGPLLSGPIIVDIDGDNKKEIVQSAGNQVFIIRYDGTSQSGWPKGMTFNTQQNASIGDINGDGSPDIVARDRDYFYNNSKIYAWNNQGRVYSGFPKNAPMVSNQPKTPILFDFNNDRKLDIVYTSNYTLNIIDYTGLSLPGWPVTIAGKNRLDNLRIGNISSADTVDIIVANGDSLYIFRTDGSLCCRPISTPLIDHTISCLTVADQDGDGISEVFLSLGSLGSPSSGYKVGLYSIFSGFLDGWPKFIAEEDNYSIEPHSRADLNGDGQPEIIWVDVLGFLRVYNSAGIALNGFPVHSFINQMSGIDPTVGDIDGDGDLEIFCDNNMNFNDSSHYHVYHHDGTEVEWSPLTIPWVTCFNSPAISDLEGDGSLEIAFVSTDPYRFDVYLYVYTIAGVAYASERFPWPMHAHDPQHTYWYDYKYPWTRLDLKSPSGKHSLTTASINYPNPFNTVTRISFILPKAMEVRISIYDLNGREVESLGTYQHSRGEHTFTWDGRENSSGIYLYCIEGDDYKLIRKMILLR